MGLVAEDIHEDREVTEKRYRQARREARLQADENIQNREAMTREGFSTGTFGGVQIQFRTETVDGQQVDYTVINSEDDRIRVRAKRPNKVPCGHCIKGIFNGSGPCRLHRLH